MTNARSYRLGRLFSLTCAVLASACASRVDPSIDDAGVSAAGGFTAIEASGGTSPLGAGGTSFTGTGGSIAFNESINQQLMTRWNLVADGLVGAFSFLWSQFDQFPHPTYKGGSAEAYQGFARVLLAFLQQSDNFDFLVANNLVDLHLVYVFPSGQNGLDTSFRQLITDFSTGSSWASIPCATRSALQQYANKLTGNSGSTIVCDASMNNPGAGGTSSIVNGAGGSN